MMRSLFPSAGKAKQTNFGPLNVPVVGAILCQGGFVVSEYPARGQEPVGHAQICCDDRQLETPGIGSIRSASKRLAHAALLGRYLLRCPLVAAQKRG
jgi:hypothetical protein